MLAQLLIWCIRIIRPILGPDSCRFHVTCTKYAAQKLTSEPLYKACAKITLRVLLCMPFTPARWITWFELNY